MKKSELTKNQQKQKLSKKLYLHSGLQASKIGYPRCESIQIDKPRFFYKNVPLRKNPVGVFTIPVKLSLVNSYFENNATHSTKFQCLSYKI